MKVAGPNVVGDTSTATSIKSDVSVNELILRYIEFAETYYVRDGAPTGELHNVKDAMRSLRSLYGLTRAAEFGPRALKLVRQHLIDAQGLCRGVINARIDRVKRLFKWAVSEEMVPPSVYEGLRAVSGLRFGRSNAREADPVRPVPDADVVATLRILPPIVGDMVRLQRITGMRSYNLVTLRPCDLDRTADVWVYEPVRHKTQHHRRKLFILIGPKARAILERTCPTVHPAPAAFHQLKWRNGKLNNGRLWADRARLASTPAKRDVWPGRSWLVAGVDGSGHPGTDTRQPPTAGQSRTRSTKLKGSESASVAGTRTSSATMATEVRKQYGVEGAQLALGHSKANITEVYAERDLEFAKRIAQDRLISSQAELAVGKCLTKEEVINIGRMWLMPRKQISETEEVLKAKFPEFDTYVRSVEPAIRRLKNVTDIEIRRQETESHSDAPRLLYTLRDALLPLTELALAVSLIQDGLNQIDPPSPVDTRLMPIHSRCWRGI